MLTTFFPHGDSRHYWYMLLDIVEKRVSLQEMCIYFLPFQQTKAKVHFFMFLLHDKCQTTYKIEAPRHEVRLENDNGGNFFQNAIS